MSEYRETRRVVEDPPIRRARPVVETQYDSVIHERSGLSGGAVVALVLAGIAAAVLITLMIVNSQQQQNEDQLALERERMEEAQQPSQPQPSQPQQPVIVLPPSQPPAQVPVPVPAPSPGASNTAPSSTEVELDITTRLLDDPDLRSQAIDVKFSDGTAVLSGRVSTDELKTRADRIVRAIKGVRTVINNISVESR